MIVLEILVIAVLVALAVWFWRLMDPEVYHRAYARAERQDVEFYRAHPDCSLEEAHRNRDRVNRRFGR